ncbi:MAG: hypothetical protein ACI9DO_003006, partial [Reinekea sp.]
TGCYSANKNLSGVKFFLFKSKARFSFGKP